MKATKLEVGKTYRLLAESGWYVTGFLDLDTRPWGEPYRYGIWVCEL